MELGIVDVVIGLSFLFFLMSIAASAVSEGIAGVFKLRARTLENGIVNLLTGTTHPGERDLAQVHKLYAHSLISGYGKANGKPSYLAARSFRNALLDITGLLEATSDPTTDPLRAEEVRRSVEAGIDEIHPA